MIYVLLILCFVLFLELLIIEIIADKVNKSWKNINKSDKTTRESARHAV